MLMSPASSHAALAIMPSFHMVKAEQNPREKVWGPSRSASVNCNAPFLLPTRPTKPVTPSKGEPKPVTAEPGRTRIYGCTEVAVRRGRGRTKTDTKRQQN